MMSRAVQAHGKGGMEDHIKMLTDGLSAKGNDVTIITTRHPEGKEYEKQGRVETYYLKNSTPGKYSKTWWTETLKKFEELNGSKKFDAFHSQSAAGFYFLKDRLNDRYGVPAVVSLHGTSLDEIKTQKNILLSTPRNLKDVRDAARAPLSILKYVHAYYMIDPKYLRNADAVIATSNEQNKLIQKAYSIDDKRVFTVFNGIDTRMFVPRDSGIRRKYDISEDEKVLLCVARLKKEKGIHNVIRVMRRLLKKQAVRLIVVGDGEYRKTLETLARKEGLQGKVTFTGFVRLDELPGYFNACDIFINATIRQDGYDLTILEAMACGKPAIASNIGSMPTAIAHGEDGILIPRGDTDALEKRILELFSDPALCARLGGNARKKVEKQFSVDSMTEGTIRVYETVIGRQEHGQAR